MHTAALHNCTNFITKYLANYSQGRIRVLDVGSLDLNGSLKQLFDDKKYEYIGVDIAHGKNVNIVLKDPYKYPFADNEFDVVVSTSCFEHNEMFWLSFNEMVRSTKNGGFMFISAPYKDGPHPNPVDCWRFLVDGYKALAKWNKQAKFLEGFVDSRPHRDCVGIFKIVK